MISGEPFILFSSESGDVKALPDTTYEYQGKSYMYLNELPPEIIREIEKETYDFHGFKRFGKCINASYLKFSSDFPEFKTVILGRRDHRFFVDVDGETLLVSDEN